MSKDLNTKGIACSIFKKEIQYLVNAGQLPDVFTFIDSEFHMYPQKLDAILEAFDKKDCLFCYGDCHLHKNELLNTVHYSRINGLNCIEIFLGNEVYRKYRAEGAFFLLPEWTIKWERIFKELLGFSDPLLAKQFMNEMHSKLIYIDTGVYGIPNEELEAISIFFSLPVEVVTIDLNNLQNAITEGLKQLKNEE